MSKSDIFYVGCDDGHAEIKLAIRGPGIEGVKEVRVPSRAILGAISTGTNGEVSERAYETEGKSYSVVPTGGDDTRTDDYHVSGMNRVLIHHALRKAGLGGKKVAIATSLPPGYFFNSADGSINHSRCAEKTRSVIRPVRAADGQACAVIVKSSVYAEAVSAMIDAFTSEDGDMPEDLAVLTEQEGSVLAVVDVGGRTTDIVTFFTAENSGGVGWEIDHRQSGTVEAGVLHTRDGSVDLFCQNHGCERSMLNMRSVDDMLRTGVVRLNGIDQDARAYIEQAKRTVGEKIAHFVRTKVSARQSLDMVLLVGGGAHVFKDTLYGLFGMLRVPNAPEFANARGNLRKLMNETAHADAA